MKPGLPVVLANVYVLAVKVLDKLACLGVITTKEHALACIPKAHPLYQVGCLLFLLILPLEIQAQSTVVIKTSPIEIVVGADSLVTKTHITIDSLGVRHTTETTSYVCKLVTTSDRAFTSVGYYGSPEAGMFDIYELGVKALRGKAGIRQSADAFAAAILDPLSQSLEHLRKRDIATYRMELTSDVTQKPKMSVLSVFFLAIEGKIPTLAWRGFKVVNPESEPVEIKLLPINCPSAACSPNEPIFDGHYEEILRYRNDQEFWRKNGNVGGVRQLIEIMERSRKDVGGPIDILRITNNGAKWVTPEPKCDKEGNRITK